MNYILIFLVLSLLIGLWSPPKQRRGALIFALACVLVAFFLISPLHM